MTMKPGLLKQQGGVTGSKRQAATANEYDGVEIPTKDGQKTNGNEHGKAAKGVRTAWARAVVMPCLEGGDGGAGRGPGEIMVPVLSLEALHWGKVKKQQQPPSSLQCPRQSARLKQIVLLQLDLIEQQQQQLHLKEREIDGLKAEKETLLARLERMKRRMQLVKKENEKDKCRLIPTVDGIEEKNITESEKVHQQMTLEQPLAETHTDQTEMYSGKGYKRKSVLGTTERKAPVKKLVAEFSRVQTKLAKSPQFRQAASGPLPDKVSKRELRSKEIPEKYKSQTWEGHKSSMSPGLPIGKDQSGLNDIEEEPYLCTTEMYLCQWHQRPHSFLREASPKKEETVAIPSWKDHSVEPLIDLQPNEIFENLDDCVFAKRHAKLELDEKRRKRWDIQRIREQRLLQRLQLRMYKKKGIQESESEILSFFPETDDVESLVITPFLPVVAFGRPLPKLSQQNFGLPWLDERSRCRIEIQKKQTPHQTCRK